MSTTLTSFNLTLKAIGSYKQTGVHLNETKNGLSKTLDDSLADGTAIDQAQKYVAYEYSLSAGASVVFDLAGTSLSSGAVALVDPVTGANQNYTKVKTFIFHNQSVVVGEILTLAVAVGDSWKAWAEPIGPNGIMVRHEPSAAGMAVTAGTADLLKVTNAGAAANTFDLIFVGI